MSLINGPRKARPAAGFTLIELLVVVAIIGIIAAILIPNFLNTLQKAKQKRTIADMKLVGTAWMSWLTDQMSAAAAGSTQTAFDWSSFNEQSHEELTSDLVPRYMADLPPMDGWRFTYEFGRLDDLQAPIPIAIRARGNDNEFDGDSYEFGPFVATDYARDIVWAGGFFVAWPSGLSD